MDWYPHNIDDFDADTVHLSPLEDGCYCRLLRWYYKNERPLPSDDRALASICRIGMDEWMTVSSTLRHFFVTRDTRNQGGKVMHHKRCDGVILSQNKRRKDWKARQEKLRKHGIVEAVTRDDAECHAPIGEERIGKEKESTSLRSVGATEKDLLKEKLVATKPRSVKVRQQMPTDWWPTPEAMETVRKLGVDPEKSANDCKSYHVAKGDSWKDWDLTYVRWAKRDLEMGRNLLRKAVTSIDGVEPTHDLARQLMAVLPPGVIKSWINPLRWNVDLDLVIYCPTKFHRDQVDQNYRTAIEKVLGGNVEFRVEPGASVGLQPPPIPDNLKRTKEAAQ